MQQHHGRVRLVAALFGACFYFAGSHVSSAAMRRVASTVPMEHLYVGTGNRNATVVYPLINGLPGPQPSRVVYYRYGETIGEAVGPDGTVHVVRYNAKTGGYFHDEYFPYSTGLRETAVDIRAKSILVDADDYVYIGGDTNNLQMGVIEVFSPGPHRRKVQEFSAMGYAPFSMTLNREGTLYETPGADWVLAFATPRKSARYLGKFCTHHREFFLSDAGGVVYTGGGEAGLYPHGFAGFNDRKLECPATPVNVIRPEEVVSGYTSQLTTQGNRLYGIVSTTLISTGILMTFDTSKGLQEPLNVLDNPNFYLGFWGYVGIGP